MADWIVVVDDDVTNLKVAGHILSKHNKRVTALKSGSALLNFIRENRPDLILLDIKMPVMDGFETLSKLRELEKELGIDEIPVVFLTADEETSSESRGFEIGVSDYIRKPFEPEILVKRIDNIIDKQEKIHHFKDEATLDKLTGFLNKAAVSEKLRVYCGKLEGYLMMIDLDSFKLVNDLYGHDMGDKVLIMFAELLKEELPESSIMGRIGGDEFVAFCTEYTSEDDVKNLTMRSNAKLLARARELMGADMEIPLGISIGVIYVADSKLDYTEALCLADKALYSVKQKDKHGYAMYRDDLAGNDEKTSATGLKALSMILSERNIPDNALVLEKDAFINVYRFIMRYLKRYHRSACRLLFTLSPFEEEDTKFNVSCDRFVEHVKDNLRKSDLVMRYRKNQLFVFLTDIKEFAITQVVNNIIKSWKEGHGEVFIISYEIDGIEPENTLRPGSEQAWIAVVDDDRLNLKVASHILTKNDMRVSTFGSGEELLEFVKDNIPDLILLDVKMPGMDGFETMTKLRLDSDEVADIPVIFLTANEDDAYEARGLSLGAMDFIRKPFIPEVLVLRVKHIIELIRLQRTLYQEVERKTKENENLFLHVVESLAQAIDAKDSYTNGHSSRVAEYSREIAKRYGYNAKQQADIYMMGLLHDVGKIGVPDAVIRKPAKLTEDEYEVVKRHSDIGAQILKNINEMPNLAMAARWHHERFGGGGYPDGLSGDEIPEAAKIIAVSDAYDAMTSSRSYRKQMTQEQVRAELENGKGKQFDPVFADIMLKMMDEDKEYKLKEHNNEN